jgi:aldehyde dehydrogenase (NAD+)
VLKAVLALIEEREDQILQALEQDLGKPRTEAWLAEVMFVKQELRYFLKHLKRWVRPRRVGNPFFFLPARSEIRREPFGTVLVMAPWNYPFQLALSPAIAAIAAGNSVVIKPSEATPATAELMRQLVEDATDPKLLTVICGDAKVGEALLAQDFDFFFFTGGEKVGALVAQAAARRMVPCVLELGGKCPAVIDGSADLELAVERIVLGKFFNAGQTCIAPDFVAVPANLLEDFEKKVNHVLERSYGSGEMEIARCVNAAQRDRILSLIPDDAQRVGSDGADGLQLAPRWAVVAWDHASMKEEIFGPFLPVVGYKSPDDLLDQLHALPSPLALYLFSRESSFCERFMQAIPSGSVGINDVVKQATNLELPFGGVGASGHGRYRGRSGFNAFSYERAVTKRYFLRDLFQVKPPFGNTLEKLRRWVR